MLLRALFRNLQKMEHPCDKTEDRPENHKEGRSTGSKIQPIAATGRQCHFYADRRQPCRPLESNGNGRTIVRKVFVIMLV